jgi:chitosanase
MSFVTPPIKKKIKTIVGVFETSSLKPRYSAVATLADGPYIPGTETRRRQVTYGAHQTPESSNLGELLRRYCFGEAYRFGEYRKELQPFVKEVGKWTLASNERFKQLLRLAGDTCEVMQQCQEDFFEEFYWKPAFAWFTENSFTLPLAMAVIFDSYIHSGSIPAWLRDDFPQVPPAKGGDEKAWTTAYVHARDYWLEHHPDKILRNTDYRTDCWLEQLTAGNWMLTGTVTCKFNTEAKADWITVP